MATRHRQERADIFRGSWKGRGALLSATRNLLAARQVQEKAEQLDRQRLERAVPDKDRGQFPSYEEWLHQRHHGLAQGWRHRERRPPGIEGPTFARPAPQDIRAFAPVVEGWHVHYRRVGELGSPAFTDRGKEIDIYDSNRRESVLAARQLSAQKWGTFTIRGNERFRSMCVELAAEHGFKIANPELQQAIACRTGADSLTSRERPRAPERRAWNRRHESAAFRRRAPRATGTSKSSNGAAFTLRIRRAPPDRRVAFSRRRLQSDDVKSYDLVWLLHLVGDVHQPLHCTSRFDHEQPDGDRGGNLVALCAAPCKNELHAFWDDLLGTNTDPRAAIRKGDDLPEPDPHFAAIADPATWIEQSFQAATMAVYVNPIGIGPGPFTVDANYEKRARALALKMVALAAVRLANLLNDSLKSVVLGAHTRADAHSVGVATERMVMFNQHSLTFHDPNCVWARKCTRNCISVPLSEAIKQGGVPCKVCGGGS